MKARSIALSLTAAAAIYPTPSRAQNLVDSGYFVHTTHAVSDATLQSERWQAGNGSHQSDLTGFSKRILGTTPFRSHRRAYFAFDLGAVSDPVVAATLRLWAPAPSAINGDTGAYPGLLPSPRASRAPDCLLAGAEPCGRFIDIPLDASGVAALNASVGGIWLLGAAISSVDLGGEEQLWAGTLVDFQGDPDFATPGPQLVLDFATAVPALSVAAQLLLGLALLSSGALWTRPFRRPARARPA